MSIEERVLYFNQPKGNYFPGADKLMFLPVREEVIQIECFNKSDLKMRGDFLSLIRYKVETTPKPLFLWGFYVDMVTLNVYMDRKDRGGEMTILFNFRDFLEYSFQMISISTESILNALQRYKLTGNLKGLYYGLLEPGKEGNHSLISHIIQEQSPLNDRTTISYGTFAIAVTKLVNSINAFTSSMQVLNLEVEDYEFKEVVSSNRKSFLNYKGFLAWVDSFRLPIDPSVPSPYSKAMNDISKAIGNSYDLINGSSDEILDSAIATPLLWASSAEACFHPLIKSFSPKDGESIVKTINAMELIDTLQGTDEVIYSSDPLATLQKVGLSKMLDEVTLKRLSGNIESFGISYLLGGSNPTYGVVRTTYDNLVYSDTQEPLGFGDSQNVRRESYRILVNDLKHLGKIVSYIRGVQ